MKLKINSKARVATTLGIAGLLTLSFQNCGRAFNFDGSQMNVTAAAGEILTSDKNFNLVSASKYVCEPFGNSSGAGDKQAGLKASLRYLDQTKVTDNNEKNKYFLPDYFADVPKNIVVTEQSLYFTSVNTPGRIFSTGFMQSDGTYLKNNNEENLIEYFALEYNSTFKLQASDKPGYYRFATLSDDGSTLEMKIDGQWKKVVDSDGLHSVRMGCADSAVYIDAKSEIPLRLRYFQGPREHIANQLIWQYVGNTSTLPTEPSCGFVSTSEWFDLSNSSNVLPKYAEIQSRGWSVVPAPNFRLPENEVNPCAVNQDLDLGDFQILSNANGSLVLSFSTSAFMQASITVSDSTGTVVQAVTEGSVLKSHQVSLTNLDTSKTYRIDVKVSSDALGVMYNRSYNLIPKPADEATPTPTPVH